MNKILLVDDDRELTSLLKELLEMEGFNVIVAHDGEQALDLLDDSIDLLLLDVMMPKKNGIDTLKALRQTHQTPVIMLTARGSELDRVLGLELGADDYLPKPFNDKEDCVYEESASTGKERRYRWRSTVFAGWKGGWQNGYSGCKICEKGRSVGLYQTHQKENDKGRCLFDRQITV